jgi:hypothetical protein
MNIEQAIQTLWDAGEAYLISFEKSANTLIEKGELSQDEINNARENIELLKETLKFVNKEVLSKYDCCNCRCKNFCPFDCLLSADICDKFEFNV